MASSVILSELDAWFHAHQKGQKQRHVTVETNKFAQSSILNDSTDVSPGHAETNKKHVAPQSARRSHLRDVGFGSRVGVADNPLTKEGKIRDLYCLYTWPFSTSPGYKLRCVDRIGLEQTGFDVQHSVGHGSKGRIVRDDDKCLPEIATETDDFVVVDALLKK